MCLVTGYDRLGFVVSSLVLETELYEPILRHHETPLIGPVQMYRFHDAICTYYRPCVACNVQVSSFPPRQFTLSPYRSLTCNVPRNQPDHVTNPIKFSMITTT
jgi:hypothetical protein